MIERSITGHDLNLLHVHDLWKWKCACRGRDMALKAFAEHGVVPDVTDSAPAAVANVRSLQPRMRTWVAPYCPGVLFTLLQLPGSQMLTCTPSTIWYRWSGQLQTVILEMCSRQLRCWIGLVNCWIGDITFFPVIVTHTGAGCSDDYLADRRGSFLHCYHDWWVRLWWCVLHALVPLSTLLSWLVGAVVMVCVACPRSPLYTVICSLVCIQYMIQREVTYPNTLGPQGV